MELRAKREEEERKRREEKRRQQQQEEQKRRQEEEELFRRKQVGAPEPQLAGERALVRSPHCVPLLGAAAGAVAEVATAAAAGSPRAPRAQLPAPTLGWPGQAGAVHEDTPGVAAGGRAAAAQTAPTSGASSGPGPQPPSGEQARNLPGPPQAVSRVA